MSDSRNRAVWQCVATYALCGALAALGHYLIDVLDIPLL